LSVPRLLAALLLLVAACSERAPPLSAPIPSPAGETDICRIGPDGGPPPQARPVRTAEDDRGIGGTGIQLASDDGDRGIGGTGIVGVVTGFASICVNGMHVGYDPTLPVVFGAVMAPPSALRVGQVVAISAAERDGTLQARRVAVRYEVSGPVEAVEPGAIRVAGQRVTLVGAVPGGTDWKVGDSILVSGLRAPDGSIIASRIDPRPAGAPRTVTVHGVLMQRDGVLSVGNLPIRVGPGLLLPDPGPVIATGMIEDGVLTPVSVAPDMLLRDPTVWFGPGYGRFLYEGYVSLGAGMVTLGSALRAPAPAGIAPFGARRGVVELRPGPAGGLTATGLRNPTGAPMTGGPLGGLRQAPMPGGMSGGMSGARGAPRGELAPMPDRSFDRRQGPGGQAAGRGFGMPSGERSGGSDRVRRDRSDSDDRSPPQPGGFQGGGFQGGQGGGGQGGGPQSIGPQGGGFFGRGR
jgi:hypothetical protein